MPASNLAQLLNFETYFEDALANYITSQVAVQILTPRTPITDESELQTPRIALRFSITSEGEHFGQYTSNITRDSRTGQFEIICVTRRDEDQDIGYLMGVVRSAMIPSVAVFSNANALPYYQTTDIRELSSSQGITGANDEIAHTTIMQLDFAIKPDAWPNT